MMKDNIQQSQKQIRKINSNLILEKVKIICPQFYPCEKLYQQYYSTYSDMYLKLWEFNCGECLYDAVLKYNLIKLYYFFSITFLSMFIYCYIKQLSPQQHNTRNNNYLKIKICSFE